jgi:AcrR family transcriptional regulator
MQEPPPAPFDVLGGPLPSGRHSLTRDVVLASQRGRLLEAMAEAVAEHGYGPTTIAHVVSRAGVSRKTFYEHFDDKRHCFIETYDTAIGFVLGRIAFAVEDQKNPRERLAVGLRTFLDVLSEEPAFCRAIVVEVQAAGAVGLARRRATLQVFAERYVEVNRQAREANPRVESLSLDLALAVVGAILELVASRVEEGRTAELGELA